MSLDFVVLNQDEAPEKTVALGVDLHYELITAASAVDLTRFQKFADYYEDAEAAIDDLPSLLEQAQTLRSQTNSTGLQYFLDELCNLIAYAMVKGRSVHAIAD